MSERPYDWAEELVPLFVEEEGMAVEGDWPGWGYGLLVIGAVAVLVSVIVAVALNG